MARLFGPAKTTSTDEALVRSLYEDHSQPLLAYATRLTGDRAAAEDVVQEALVRAWRNAGALAANADSVRAWLFTVTRNLVIDRVRARSARPAEVAESPAFDPVLVDHAQRVVDSMSVLAAIERLSEDHRRVLVEIYFHDRSVADAARALGITPGTVKSRSHYAVQALRLAMVGAPERTPA
ncbi:sigma-70 family RNA polymerase sigma factor [Actinokineospora sp. NBRC 105648]|uniref:sigma-70 family RNA polymerase sigma factor n=1 Tax=Actinokineospora sp. NBRC 105648 TaxID=3032206 RepID=UPI0024A575EE|nr:sigma-70 family RNA polymerase sigma factor [Actinokineospora sp. NBRC 105648]GLZ38695.1 DNA-directed RNA polymerase sigma-70 factor [Actinokineospora sp. NBRC 105648]